MPVPAPDGPSLPLLASPADLGARAEQDIADDNAAANRVLSMASTVVRAYARTDFADAIPGAARDVTVEVAYRVWRNPEGVIADSIDDAGRRFPNVAADGFYLTSAERLVLDQFRPSRGGLWTLGVTRNDSTADTIYVPTAPEPSGEPFPWYASDDPMVQP